MSKRKNYKVSLKNLSGVSTQKERADTLTIAEQQLVEILKGLIRNPKVLILDEPTNDLDVETLELLEELLTDYQGTLIIVSHDRQFIDNTVEECFFFEGMVW